MKAELHVAFNFQKTKSYILKFQKQSEKILDVSNDVFYTHAKSKCEILCILSYTKMKNVWSECSEILHILRL
jgi:hypothetical protein